MKNPFKKLTPEQAALIREALLSHDGKSISTKSIGKKKERLLTDALDILRVNLWDISLG